MRKIMASLIVGSFMAIGAPAYAEQVTGTPTYFFTGGFGTNGVSCALIVNGLFYYYNGYSPAIITSIDLARRVKGTITFSADSGRAINGAY